MNNEYYSTLTFSFQTLSAYGFNPILAVLGGLVLMLNSCVSSKDVVYFQGATATNDSILVTAPYVPLIQPADVLSVQINSLNPEKSVIFNPYAATPGTAAIPASTGSLPAPVGYIVSSAGEMTIPLLGPVKVSNLLCFLPSLSCQLY